MAGPMAVIQYWSNDLSEVVKIKPLRLALFIVGDSQLSTALLWRIVLLLLTLGSLLRFFCLLFLSGTFPLPFCMCRTRILGHYSSLCG